MSRTCWPGLTSPSGTRAGSALCAATAVSSTFFGGVDVSVDGVDHRVGQHHRGELRLRRVMAFSRSRHRGGFSRMHCPAGLLDVLVGGLFGRVGHHPVRVVGGGALGVVGVEVEMHVGVAVVVLLAPA